MGLRSDTIEKKDKWTWEHSHRNWSTERKKMTEKNRHMRWYQAI